MENRRFVKYILVIAITSVIAFFIHTALLSQLGIDKYENKIILAYVLNTILALLILSSLYIFRRKMRDQLGFLFMAGSFIKFAVFFIFFYPTYQLDGETSSSEFTAFFIPYAICLITETFGGVKLLNSLD